MLTIDLDEFEKFADFALQDNDLEAGKKSAGSAVRDFRLTEENRLYRTSVLG